MPAAARCCYKVGFNDIRCARLPALTLSLAASRFVPRRRRIYAPATASSIILDLLSGISAAAITCSAFSRRNITRHARYAARFPAAALRWLRARHRCPRLYQRKSSGEHGRRVSRRSCRYERRAARCAAAADTAQLIGDSVKNV